MSKSYKNIRDFKSLPFEEIERSDFRTLKERTGFISVEEYPEEVDIMTCVNNISLFPSGEELGCDDKARYYINEQPEDYLIRIKWRNAILKQVNNLH